MGTGDLELESAIERGKLTAMRMRSSRWTRRFPKTLPAARWRRWAAGLVAAHRRVLVGRSRPALVLVTWPGREPAASPAPHLVSLTFAPRLQLAIAVLLPAAVRETRASPARIIRMAAAPSFAGSPALASGPRRLPAAPRRAAGASLAATPRRRAPLGIAPASPHPIRGAEVAATAERDRAVAGRPPAIGATPRRTFDARGDTPIGSPALVLAEGARVLQRVRDERRRVEQRAAQPMTTRSRPDALQPAAIAVPGFMAQSMVATSPWGDPARATALAERAIDIPRLTDQVIEAINHRIVASRERQGRAF
jgi:hypothetical protein